MPEKVVPTPRAIHRRSFYRPHPRLKQHTGETSRTKQQFAGEANINTIMAKYQKTGVLPEGRSQNTHGDFIGLPEYQDAMQIVIDAQETFDRLPSSIRKRFNNDPGQFLDFTQDEKNIPEMRSLGLMAPEEPKQAPVEPEPPKADKEPVEPAQEPDPA